MKWIKTSEELPDPYTDVLGSFSGGAYTTVYLTPGGWFESWGNYYETYTPEYWCYIAPPEGDES